MAALIGVGSSDSGGGDMRDIVEKEQEEGSLDGVPIFDDRPIDFSGGAGLDGEPMVRICVIVEAPI